MLPTLTSSVPNFCPSVNLWKELYCLSSCLYCGCLSGCNTIYYLTGNYSTRSPNVYFILFQMHILWSGRHHGGWRSGDCMFIIQTRKGVAVHPEHILGTYLTMTSTIVVVSNTVRVVFLAGRSFGRATIKDDGRETSDD